jgi:hypothetical protein
LYILPPPSLASFICEKCRSLLLWYGIYKKNSYSPSVAYTRDLLSGKNIATFFYGIFEKNYNYGKIGDIHIKDEYFWSLLIDLVTVHVCS